ncbi:MAG TPA: transposase [Elusimicrobia bacterium]|nr:transposase [Elusimicrobiota bacterium]
MEYRKWWSPALGQDMELKVYGHGGKPVLVFPSAGGRFWDYEGFGMVGACGPFLESGRVQLFAIDCVDNQSWTNGSLPIHERVRRHEQYERYVMDEAVPFVRDYNRSGQALLATGCSGGAYHSANFFFRHPDVFDSVIALSGLYSPKFLFGDYWEDSLYFHFPLAYLPGLGDERQLELIRRAKIVLCVGQGAWERCDQYDCIGETLAMKNVMEAKGIPCWVDLWGQDAQHEWYWWRRQMPYFLGHLL